MKRFNVFFVLGMSLILSFTSCKKESKTVEKFVGTYSMTATMNMSVIIDGEAYSIDPQTMKGYLTISKLDDGKRVVDIGDFYETTAIIDGNTIMLNSVQVSGRSASERYSEVLNINFQIGKLDGSTLNFDAICTGTTYHENGVAYPVVGTITHTAKKI